MTENAAATLGSSDPASTGPSSIADPLSAPPAEVSADQPDRARELLGSAMGRNMPIPDLSSAEPDKDLHFLRGTLLATSGKPAGALVYLDRSGRRVAFCLMRSTRRARGVRARQQEDLHLIDWRDGRYGYVLVGKEPDVLDAVLPKVQEAYSQS